MGKDTTTVIKVNDLGQPKAPAANRNPAHYSPKPFIFAKRAAVGTADITARHLNSAARSTARYAAPGLAAGPEAVAIGHGHAKDAAGKLRERTLAHYLNQAARFKERAQATHVAIAQYQPQGAQAKKAQRLLHRDYANAARAETRASWYISGIQEKKNLLLTAINDFRLSGEASGSAVIKGLENSINRLRLKQVKAARSAGNQAQAAGDTLHDMPVLSSTAGSVQQIRALADAYFNMPAHERARQYYDNILKGWADLDQVTDRRVGNAIRALENTDTLENRLAVWKLLNQLWIGATPVLSAEQKAKFRVAVDRCTTDEGAYGIFTQMHGIYMNVAGSRHINSVPPEVLREISGFRHYGTGSTREDIFLQWYVHYQIELSRRSLQAARRNAADGLAAA
jgi:hypothetical protein